MKTSDAVFAGVVESVDPDLRGWERAVQKRLGVEHPLENGAVGFPALRAALLDVAPEPYRSRIAALRDEAELGNYVEELGRWVKVRFRVDEVYRGRVSSTTEILAQLYGCSVEFRAGETYLVLADLEGGQLRSHMCSPSRELKDAGEYLAYLHMLKFGGDKTARVYGWVTGDRADLAIPPYWDGVKVPRANAVVLLQQGSVSRRATTDQNGRFSFDRVGAGEYSLSVLGQREERVSVSRDDCVRKVLYVSPSN